MKREDQELTQEELYAERKKIISNLVLLSAAFVVVLIALGTMAWFASNKDVSGDGMQINMTVPERIQISVGRTGNYYLNTEDDFLDLNGGSSVRPPRNNEENDEYDWAEFLEIDHYYSFGKLFPASSDSGEHILFTPDAISMGRKLGEGARFFLADGKTDGDIKNYLNRHESDSDSLMATVYPIQNDNEMVSFHSGTTWFDTNDDGYYVDIPLWFRTNYKVSVSLSAEGYITGSEVTEGEEAWLLYRAVRVAFLEEGESGLEPLVKSKDGEDIARNILPLQDATDFGTTANSIVNSKNYTINREEANDDRYYGMRIADSLVKGVKQGENYYPYNIYGYEWIENDEGEETEVEDPVALMVLEPAEEEEWSEIKKAVMRVWLDGDGEDCWNATVGQNWSIHIRFSIMEND